jgi:hypothetical protein
MRARNSLERLRHLSSEKKRIGVEIKDDARRANYVRTFDFKPYGTELSLAALLSVYSLLR